jgi:hypothetical protein
LAQGWPVIDLDADALVAGDVGAAEALGFDGGALVDVESSSVMGDGHDVPAFGADDGEEGVVQHVANNRDGDGPEPGDLAGLAGDGAAA